MTVYDDPHSAAADPSRAAAHAGHDVDEVSDLGDRGATVANAALVTGVVCLLLGVVAAFVSPVRSGVSYALHGYVLAWTYVLSLCLGALFFVLLQHLFRAGWSVNLRRVPEALAACLPAVAVMGAPILLSVLAGQGTPYIWAQYVDGPTTAAHEGEGHDADTPTAGVSDALADVTEADTAPEPDAAAHPEEHHGYKALDDLTYTKYAYLNPVFFTIRALAYVAFWSYAGRLLWRLSTAQDADGDPAHTRRAEVFSAPGLLLFGVLITFAAFDLLMSLDPHWYSTIFGVYYWAGAAVGGFALMIVALNALQRFGFLTASVTTEHYHDLGKFLFASVFFWGYVAFSQYMLMWYANIPEEAPWFDRRGATTVVESQGLWTWVAAALLAGHLLIPFAGLLSRHVKRHKGLLTFWAVWLLIFHWIDLWWLVLPEMEEGASYVASEALLTLGLLGLLAWRFTAVLGRASLRPLRDPRVEESYSFTNI